VRRPSREAREGAHRDPRFVEYYNHRRLHEALENVTQGDGQPSLLLVTAVLAAGCDAPPPPKGVY